MNEQGDSREAQKTSVDALLDLRAEHLDLSACVLQRDGVAFRKSDGGTVEVALDG